MPGDARLLDGPANHAKGGIHLRKRFDLFRRTPAEFVADRVRIGKMNEAKIRLVGKDVTGGVGRHHPGKNVSLLFDDLVAVVALQHHHRIGAVIIKFIHRVRLEQMAEFFLTDEHGRGKAGLLGGGEYGGHADNAIGGPPIVPTDVVRFHGHASQHGRVGRQCDRRMNGLRVPRAGTFLHQFFKHRHFALLNDSGLAAVNADDENVFRARRGAGDEPEATNHKEHNKPENNCNHAPAIVAEPMAGARKH